MTYDAIVLGLGGMGSAALAQLALRGKRVVGFERFGPGHAMGSSHGDSRIIRRAYPLDPSYVPLVLRAYDLWRELEARSGASLLKITGGLFLGRPDTVVVSGGLASVREHGIAHELLEFADLRRRFPAMAFRKDEVALFEPESGVVYPELGILAHLNVAIGAGAEARFGTPVVRWEPTPGGGVRVSTPSGETVEAARLIISAGAWFGKVAPELGLPLRVERNIMHYFGGRPDADRAALEGLPIYVVQRDEGRIYGFPSLPGAGLKIAYYHSDEFVDPDTVDRTSTPAEAEPMRAFLTGLIPSAAGPHLRARVCLYTMTPDEHFVIGLHPQHAQVALAGGFSGHGYKFCSVVGEILADLATAGASRNDIARFAPARFAQQQAATISP